MVKNFVRNRIKKEFETLGEQTGQRVGQAISREADKKAARIGKKLGETAADQMGRLHDRLEKETVTNQEQLGIGGKLGTGLGLLAKNLVEKRYGMFGKLAGSRNLVSEGRVLGAKAEKMVKRAVRTGVDRMAKGADKTTETVSSKKPEKDNV